MMGIDRKEGKALFRFGVIFPLLDERLDERERSRLIEEASRKRYDIPGSSKTGVSAATIRKWYNAYRKDPSVDTLAPSGRSDKNSRRKLSPETEKALLSLRDKHPEKPLKVIVRMAREQNLFMPGDTIGDSAIYRMFREHKSKAVDTRGAKDMRRFEVESCNELWMTDCMHGPKVVLPSGAKVTAKLFALIDDRSRLITYGRFYPSETTDCFLDCLWEAFRRRGLPHRIFTDNGSAFKNDRMRYGCASLDVLLQFSKVRHPAGKAKIERFWLTVRQQFLSCIPEEPLSLDELNRRWEIWVDGYNRRPHSSLAGEDGRQVSPLECYLSDIKAVRRPPEDLPRHFWNRDKRLVSQARTISIGNRLFQVPLGYAGKKIDVCYYTLEHVEASFNGKDLGVLAEVDLHANANFVRCQPVEVEA